MDRESRFTPGTDEFAGLMGPRTTAAFGRPWREIAETFGFDPTGRMMQAFATRRHMERHHAELAGGRRRHLARRTVRPADLRCARAISSAIAASASAAISMRSARLAALRLAELCGEVVTPQEAPADATCRADQRCIAFIR